MKDLLYVQEAQLDKFLQKLSISSATSNVAHAITSQNSSINGGTFGSYQGPSIMVEDIKDMFITYAIT